MASWRGNGQRTATPMTAVWTSTVPRTRPSSIPRSETSWPRFWSNRRHGRRGRSSSKGTDVALLRHRDIWSDSCLSGEFGDASCLLKLRLDPAVGGHQPFTQRDARLPPQHLAELGVVAVPTPYPLRFGEIVPPNDALTGDFGHQIHQLIDRDQFVGPQVEWLGIIGAHNPVDSFNAVVHAHERTGLFSVSPDHYLFSVGSQGHLATDSCWSLFLASFVSAERSVDVVKADHSSLESIVFAVILAQLFHEKLLGTVSFLGPGRVGVLLLEIRDVRALLKVLWVDTSRGREEQPLGR